MIQALIFDFDGLILDTETPEFRIADDIRLAVDPLVDLSVGFTGSVLIAVTFFTVLATVGGSLEIPALGITVPAYFLIGAVVYALVMSGIASLAGWPLIRKIELKNHREGMFRYELTRFREHAAQSGPPAEPANAIKDGGPKFTRLKRLKISNRTSSRLRLPSDLIPKSRLPESRRS